MSNEKCEAPHRSTLGHRLIARATEAARDAFNEALRDGADS